MTDAQRNLTVIAGLVSRKTSNRLRMTFNDGPGDPIADAVQSGGDGRGAGVGILFGFKNGGAGNHVLDFTDGHQLVVSSRDSQPTEITRDGKSFATVQRRAVGRSGSEALKIPILGTRLTLTQQVAPAVRDVLMAACVDIAIGLRPYIPEMG